ncbi:MAG: ABC-F family ATP-binding cassette domain-containing protein [Chloroflexi bacterium]|nr:ABC-F family ATP-binding cassette domain-containing protein [Chloroflexota bacterium]
MSTILLNLTDISYTYFSNPILSGLNWEIQAGQKIGLVGANGCGKSTLLKILLEQLTPEAGAIFRVKELTIGYLPQEVEPNPPAPFPTREGGGAPPLLAGEGAGGEVTVLDVALSGSPEIGRLRRELAEREAQMGDPAVYDDPARLARVMNAHGRLLHDYEVAGGLTYENRVRSTLRDLGLGDETFDRSFDILSGGQAKLVGLARLLVWRPDLLLLDEPDNHLDVAGKQVVERLVAEYDGAVVIVSHDRYLLDQCVNRIAELDRGQIAVWPGTYSTYAVNKQLAVLRQEQLYKAQQKRINQIEAAITRFELWASIVVDERHARQARARYKMLERMERIERPGEQRRMKLELGGWRGSNKVLDIGKLEKWFVDQTTGDVNVVLNGVDLLIWHGERVGLVGPNGAGKSVLFRCILAAAPPSPPNPSTPLRAGLGGKGAPPELGAGGPSVDRPDGGTIKLGPSVKIGYYAQQHETLHPDWTVMQEIRDLRPMYETEAVAFLGKFLFTYEACQKQVRQLSGGERSRLQLARLMLSDANFLLLDEPTNNLDIPSAEVLEAALEEFNGTVLVISHDRYFLDRIVDRVAGLEDGKLVEVEGGYSDYLSKFGGK